jgi:hypothetical protein
MTATPFVAASASAQSDDLTQTRTIIDFPTADPSTPATTPLKLHAVDGAGRPAEDPRFRALMGTFVGAATADIAVSMYQIEQQNGRELGFGAWWQDSPAAFAVSKAAMTAAFVYGLKRMHRSRPKTAMTLGIVATIVEGALVVHGASLSPAQPR